MNSIAPALPEISDAAALRHPVVPALPAFNFSRRVQPAFSNPIIAAPSADPWVIAWNGAYYYAESRDQTTLWIRRAENFTDLGSDEGRLVWTAPTAGANSNALWAPELHRIGNRWYIYYAADDGLNENHRMWALESAGDDPLGPYRCRGPLDTKGWAIDGTVLQRDGELYFIWSGWPGAQNGCQNLYIARMANPWTLSGERHLLAVPEHTWERVEMDICEGPQILERHGRLFIIYSASGSWTPDYCLGMLEFTGTNLLDRLHWTKSKKPVFSRNQKVWGVGHCSFLQTPDGADWIIYHAKTRKKAGWADRNVHAQPFTWTEQGHPFFGSPIPAGIEIPIPGAQPTPELTPLVAA